MSRLRPVGVVPVVGSTYFFAYVAKTKGITFDMFPLVTVTGRFTWGFSGYAHHWNQVHNYDTSEMMTVLYEVDNDDLQDALSYPCMKIIGG
jgi:hypothetical protein